VKLMRCGLQKVNSAVVFLLAVTIATQPLPNATAAAVEPVSLD